jgi:putative ABC transport system ATP-binding protein
MSMIRAVGVHKEVETLGMTITILRGVDLAVKAGESIAIMGASGSGKTTLLSLLAGLDSPSKGDIFIEDVSLNPLTEDERGALRLEKIGFVFQNFNLLPHFNALENVMLPMELAGMNNVREEATAILKQVGLGDRLYHYPSSLSGGEQQRVGIARAFASKPKILFADEPTGNLDHQTREVVTKILFELNNKMNTTLVMVTHDAFLAKQCNSVYQLTQGVLARA